MKITVTLFEGNKEKEHALYLFWNYRSATVCIASFILKLEKVALVVAD